jgi:uncharacterized Zn finger protein
VRCPECLDTHVETHIVISMNPTGEAESATNRCTLCGHEWTYVQKEVK